MNVLTRPLAPFSKNPQFAIICAMSVFVMSGVGLVAPILSVYANTFSASATLSGMIITLFGVGRLIVNLPAGLLSQRCGNRMLLIAGTVILVVGAVGAALAGSLTQLVIYRFVQGIGSGIYMTIAQAMMAQIAPPAQRGRTMALYQSAILVGTGLGPMIGGFIADHFGLAAPFWAYAVVCSIAAVLACFISEPPAGFAPDEARPKATRPRAALFTNRAFLLICIVNFGIFFTRTASQWSLIPLIAASRFDMNIAAIGLLLTAQSIANFVILPATGMMVDRMGARPLTIVSALIVAFSLLLIAFGPGSLWLWGGMVVLGLGGGLNATAIVSYAAEVAPPDSYAPAMGLLRTWGDAGFVVGPILVGTLADLADAGTVGGLVANSLMMAGAGLALLVIGRRATGFAGEFIADPQSKRA